ncbi:MAG TPA: phosphate starvation-inducible protein PhoH, partial [Gallionellaceae bacterium]|nr:phosphate starvation-inducible protein PhoH [Gallionellaceae bacterium]
MNAPTIQFALEPLDNQRLANLCGPLDENLRQIEIALEVTISRRSEHFSVQGEQAELAREVLQDFYLEAKNDITLERLQLGLIEAMKWRDDPQPADDFVPLLMTRKSEIRGRTPRQNTYLQAIQEHDITFGIGPAGTGKTYLAVACAVDALQRETVRRLVLVRPAVEAGEKLGFLPGDLAQKVDPYLRPLYDALYDLMGVEKVVKAFDRGMIEIAPLAYMRGRTLNHSFIILDEAQNTTHEQMKMFLTRLG